MRAVGPYIGSATNQQAEIVAAWVGFEPLHRTCEVMLRTDSKYVGEMMNGNFVRRTNDECWSRLDLAASTHVVTWEWVKGRLGYRPQGGVRQTRQGHIRDGRGAGRTPRRGRPMAVRRLG